MATVLFMDDMRERHRSFMELVDREKATVFPAYTALQAVDLLQNNVFDEVFLDHDLCVEDIMCKVGEQTLEPTGMVVVEHIMEMVCPPPRVIVHTCNTPAAEAMVSRLKEHPAQIEVLQIPFPHLLVLMR